MDLLYRFREFIQQEDLFHQKGKLILAVSGGVDSVVLCELCHRSAYDFLIAHCNFQLREAESGRDESFVRELGKRYGTEVLVKKFDTEKIAKENKIGIQEAARDLRYEWFRQLANRQSSIDNERKLSPENLQISAHSSRLRVQVVTAHHADDNIETVLMNFCRGTGLQGLTGIPVKSDHICRPLLDFWKEELIEFATKNKLSFVEDSSNRSSKYTRNFFRNEIIPLIAGAYPQVKSNIRDNIARFSEIQKLYEISVAGLKKKLCRLKDEEIHIPIKQLLSYESSALIYEVISEYGFSDKQIGEVKKLAKSESGKFIQSPDSSYRIIKFRNWFIIAKNHSGHADTIVIDETVGKVSMKEGNLIIENIVIGSQFHPPTSSLIACLDAKEVRYPLILRKWKPGDYFYPLGLNKKKKLARFFIDQKLSKTEKEKLWVLEMNRKILWIVGIRIDDRFKITDKTKSILKISLERF